MTLRLFPSALAGALMAGLSGCEPPEPPPPQAPDLTPKLRAEIADLQKSAADQALEIERQRQALETLQADMAEKERLLTESGNELLNLKDALAVEKAGEGRQFLEIAALQQSGQLNEARLRYERFLSTFPTSPLAETARRSLQEITAEAARRKAESQRVTATYNPGKAQNDIKKKFKDGVLSVEELVPALKGKSPQDVINLFGRPDRAFPNADEWGYDGAAINPDTGRRGMLIITFRNNAFAYLRVDYAGRKVFP